MGNKWPVSKLENHIHIKHGYAFKGEFFKSHITSDCLLTPGNFAVGGGFKSGKFKYYDGPVPESYILSKDDLTVTMTDLSKEADTLGFPALIPEYKEKRLLHNQRTGLVEFKDNELDKNYLYFLMCSREYRHHVVSGATGTTVKHTSPTKILSFEFCKPPKETQIKIGNSLITIEKRIEINNQTNQTLEQMAQTLFKSWFVDFDPVFDNLLAKADFNLANLESTLPEPLFKKAKARLSAINASESTRQNNSESTSASTNDVSCGMQNADKIKASLTALAQSSSPQLSSRNAPETDATSASILPQHSNHAHFPSEFEHNEQLGWIPKGWEVKELFQLVKHQKGFPFKSAWYQDEGHIVVRVSDTTDDSINVNSCNKISEELAAEYSSYALKENDLVIATVGSWPPNYSSVVGKVIRVPTTAEGGLLNQNAVKLTVSTEYSFHQGFLHFNLKNPRFMSYIINRAQGSANQASITLKSIFDFPMLIANDDVMRHFSDQAKFNFDKQNLNDEEIQSLTRLRDTLLPKLISGELKIPEADS